MGLSPPAHVGVVVHGRAGVEWPVPPVERGAQALFPGQAAELLACGRHVENGIELGALEGGEAHPHDLEVPVGDVLVHGEGV